MSEAEQGDLLATLADLPDAAVQRIVDADANSNARDHQLAFEQFHQANPGVYKALVDMARQLRRQGHTRLGFQTLWEHLRWLGLMGRTDSTDGYKLNNNHTSRYARLIMQQEPDLEGMFETRRMTT